MMRWCGRSALQVTNETRLKKQTERADELQDILVKSGGKETLRKLRDSHGFKPDEVHSLGRQFPERLVVETLKNTGGRQSEIVRLKCGSG